MKQMLVELNLNVPIAACGSLGEVCNGMSIEDRFFEMYKEVKGGEE